MSNRIRGVTGGGTPATDTMEYITIASTGDAADYGDLAAAVVYPLSMSDSHGGL